MSPQDTNAENRIHIRYCPICRCEVTPYMSAGNDHSGFLLVECPNHDDMRISVELEEDPHP